MNNIFKFKLSVLVAFGFIFQGCYEDKGNYDYQELTSLAIDTTQTGITEEMTAYQLENFKVPVKINYAGDKSKLDYEWKLYPEDPKKPSNSNNYEDPVILSTKEVLDTVIYEVPGKYHLVYTVKEPTAQIEEYLHIKLTIESALSRGLCVLDKKDGNYDIHMIKPCLLMSDITEEDEKVVYNIFTGVNSRQETGGRFLYQFIPRWGKKLFYFFTETGGYVLDANTFKITSDKYQDLFTLPIAIHPDPQCYMVTDRPAEIIVNNGEIYSFDHYMMGVTTFGDRLDGDYYAAPFLPRVSTRTFSTVIYDTKNGRFAPINSYANSVGVFEDTTGAEFNLNNVGKNMEIKFMENGFNNFTYAVFKNKDNSAYSMYVADFSGEKEMPVKKYDMSGCPELNDGTIYSFGNMGNICFYTSGSKLYQYKYFSKNQASVVKDFGGETITTLKVFKLNSHPQDGKLLILSTTTSSGEGKVYLIPFDELNGALDTNHMKVFSGFAKVEDLYFKE